MTASHRQPASAPRAPAGARSLKSALIAASLLAGCQSAQHTNVAEHSDAAASASADATTIDTTQATQLAPQLGNAPAIETLRTRAQRQQQSAPTSDTPPGTPPPWEPQAEPLAGAGLSNAQLPLKEVFEQIRARPLFPNTTTVAAPPEADREQALRLYAQARLALADDDRSQALTLLERASRLDPSAAQIWHALGETQFASALRSTGLQSLEQAARLGVDDPRVWSVLGLEALRRRNTDDARRWLVAALDGLGERTDAAALAWLEVSLAEILLTDQHLAAATTLLEHALTLVPDPAAGSDFRSEYATLVRRRPQLWMRVGDACAWLGEWTRAADAYERARDDASSDDQPAIEQRRIACLQRLNRSAQAALLTLESIRASNGLVSDAQRAVIPVIARDEPAFAEALRSLSALLDHPTPAQRASLAIAQLRTSADLPLAQRLDLLPPEAPLLPEHVSALLEPIAARDQRWQAAQSLVTRRPADADVVADALYAAALLPVSDLLDRSTEPQPLAAALRLRMQTPLRDLDLSALASHSGGLTPAIQTAVATGRWSQLPPLLALARQQPAPQQWRALAAALRPSEAFETWSNWRVLGEPTAANLTDAARIAAAAGLPDEATRLLIQAQQVDPYAESVYRALITHLLTTGDQTSPDIQTALQDLRRRLPGCATLDWLAVLDLQRQGYITEAIAATQSLIERNPAPSETDYDALTGPWQIAHEREQADILAHSEAWLRNRLDAAPPQPAAVLSLCHLLALQSRSDEALALLDNAALSTLQPAQRVRESLLRDLSRQDEANQSALARLSSPHLSIAETFERALITLDMEEPIEPALAPLATVPDDVRLSPDQASSLLTLCSQLQGRIVAADTEETRRPFANAFLAAAGFGIDHGLPMREPFHRLRLRYAAQQPDLTLDQLTRMGVQYADQIGQVSDEAFVETFNTLIAANRTQIAIRWGVRIASHADEISKSLWSLTLTPLATLGTIDTVDDAIAVLSDRDMLADAVLAIGLNADQPEHATFDQRAELCYILAGLADARERRTQSILLYQHALSFQPDHPWACNDYGYMLADEGKDLEQAERLLEIAYAQLPDRPNVLDSIGWLRYKQGRFLDTTHSDGSTTPGALTLMTKAADSPEGATNSTIQHHLGDIKWMCGDADGARKAWLEAESLLLDRIRTFRTPEDRRLPQYTRLQQSLRDVRQKLTALELEGVNPPVAPTTGTRIEPVSDETPQSTSPEPTTPE